MSSFLSFHLPLITDSCKGRVSPPLQQRVEGLTRAVSEAGSEASKSLMDPLHHAIKGRTATSDQVDAAFKKHIAGFLAKKNGPKDLARVDWEEKKSNEVKKMSAVAATVYHEPYYAATSSGLGTLAARANSLDAGLAYCTKVKEQKS